MPSKHNQFFTQSFKTGLLIIKLVYQQLGANFAQTHDCDAQFLLNLPFFTEYIFWIENSSFWFNPLLGDKKSFFFGDLH